MNEFLTLVTGPNVPVVSLAEAKQQLRLDAEDEDDLIEAYAWAVNDLLDARWGELGRALTTQTWRLTMNGFPTDRIVLPFPPVQSVASITYYDLDNASQTAATSLYRLTATDEEAWVDLTNGSSWPSTYDRADAVSVTFVAGYGDAVKDIPEGIRMAAKLMLSHFYENRVSVTERQMHDLPQGVAHILRKYRVTKAQF